MIRESFDKGCHAGFDAERKALVELTDTEACRNLMRLFFLRQGAKKAMSGQLHARKFLHKSYHAGSTGPGVAEVTCAAVIGGGTMGAGIAYALARAGVRVRLLEVNDQALAAGLARVRKSLDDDIRSGRLSALEARHAMSRISPSVQWTGLQLADVIIEAVVEEMSVKHDIFARLDTLAQSGCRPGKQHKLTQHRGDGPRDASPESGYRNALFQSRPQDAAGRSRSRSGER